VNPWLLSHRGDPRALPLATTRAKKPGTNQFVPPGRCIVLLTEKADALWVTSWPFAEYTKHAWAGAWMCSLFRNESEYLSSDLIRAAVAATCAIYGEPPALGMVTFIDASSVRRKRDPGRCYRKAGFKPVRCHLPSFQRGTFTLWSSTLIEPREVIAFRFGYQRVGIAHPLRGEPRKQKQSGLGSWVADMPGLLGCAIIVTQACGAHVSEETTVYPGGSMDGISLLANRLTQPVGADAERSTAVSDEEGDAVFAVQQPRHRFSNPEPVS
jgi:hypothetical protein